jgi:hypothetical protein
MRKLLGVLLLLITLLGAVVVAMALNTGNWAVAVIVGVLTLAIGAAALHFLGLPDLVYPTRAATDRTLHSPTRNPPPSTAPVRETCPICWGVGHDTRLKTCEFCCGAGHLDLPATAPRQAETLGGLLWIIAARLAGLILLGWMIYHLILG